MAIHYRTQGLILKKNDRGEADQIFTIYTKDFGKLEILAKAIRKIKSKLRSGTELFYLSEIEFIQGKTYKTLTDAILIEKFKDLRKNLWKLKIVYQIADIFDSLVEDQEKDEKIWNLLTNTFQELNNQPCTRVSSAQGRQLTINNQQLIYYYFLWRLFSFLGYQPQLYNCSVCQKKLVFNNFYFNSQEGGVICQDCFKEIKKGKPISATTIKILRFILEKDWKLVKRLKTEAKHLKSLKIISDHHLAHLLSDSQKYSSD